jgi:hypothetical protein
MSERIVNSTLRQEIETSVREHRPAKERLCTCGMAVALSWEEHLAAVIADAMAARGWIVVRASN